MNVGYLVAHRLRRGWPSLLALAVAVALVSGAAMASVAGARRSNSSMDRFLAASRPADLLVAAEPGGVASLDALGALDQVRRAGRGTLFALFPAQDLGEVFFPMISSLDGALGSEMNVPRVIEGRLADPDEPHDVALGERTARRLGVAVGDQLPMVSMAPEDLMSGDGDFPEPGGPPVVLDVVGIVRDPMDVAANETDIAITFLTPAFAERYSGQIGAMAEMAFVDLRDGGDVEAFTAAARDLDPGLEIESLLNEGAKPVKSTLEVIATSLVLLGAVIALVGSVVIAQIFHRRALAQRPEHELLGALGASRRELLLASVVPGVVAAVAGAGGAVLVATASSPLFPIGIARTAEPSPGVDLDVPVLVLGGLFVVVVVALLQVGSVLLSRRAGASRRQPGRLTSLTANASPVVTTGLVLPRVGGAAALRSARVGLAIGLAGVVAAITFATSLDELLTSPDLYGVGWDAGVAPDETSGLSGQVSVTDAQVEKVASDPAVAEAQRGIFQIEADIEGVPVHVSAVGDGSGTIGTAVTRGRVPLASDEVAIATDTLRRIGKDVGDAVEIDGGEGAMTYRIVGVAVAPVSSDGGSLTDGATMVAAGGDRLGAVDPVEGCVTDSCYQQVLVRFENGADVDAALERVAGDGTREWIGAAPPAAVQRLGEVETIPWVLAVLLALVGAGATGHALMMVARRRRRELGVLRTLGFTRQQVRSVMLVQASSLAATGVVLGVIAGVAIGRTVWRAVATSAGVVSSAVIPAPWVALAAATIVAIALAAAGIPTLSAARLRPAQILRVE